jgi:crotonobetainyl-CoA:carnitine CoA-transferase CaiB-like acyl-CoA transferase
VLGLEPDARFATNPDRVQHRAELAELIEAATRTWQSDELLARLVEAGIPASPVRDVGEAARHPQTEALGILQQLGDFTTLAQPISFDGERLRHRSPPPALAPEPPLPTA